ncbi:MAG TPA: hypothetical protein VF746_05880 [Longimicrobium sp.]|jgi:hypothetical protein
MPSPVSSWFERLPEDIDRRLDRVEATAREDLIETHARLAGDLVSILAPRMPFDEAIERYLESMNLEGDDAEAVGTRAVTMLDEQEIRDDSAREGHRGWGFDWRYATPLGALRFIQRHRKRSAEEQLWLELAAARAEEKLVDEHAMHARRFVEILEDEVDPTRAVELYVDRLKLPEIRARLVYQRVLAALAEELLPRLPDEDEEDGPGSVGAEEGAAAVTAAETQAEMEVPSDLSGPEAGETPAATGTRRRRPA